MVYSCQMVANVWGDSAMTTPVLALDRVLYVGQRVFFYPEPLRKAAHSIDAVIRGWQAGGYILAELVGPRQRAAALRQGGPCSIRFLKEGTACAIDSEVVDIQLLSQRPTVRVAWTDRVRTASLRRSERIDLTLPCEATVRGRAYEGKVRDMSTGGIGILLECPAEVGEKVKLSCRLPDGFELIGTPMIVRNIRREPDGRGLFGCAFAEERGRDAQAAGFYVTSTLMRMRGAVDDASTVLILDHDAIATALMQKRLQEFGVQCEVLPNLLDGVFRARLRAPVAILARYDWGDITATEVCRLLRMGPALRDTAIFVYGDGAEHNALEVRRAGATGSIASIARPNEVLDYLCKAVPQVAAG